MTRLSTVLRRARWYAARLTAMPPAEIPHRFAELARRTRWRRQASGEEQRAAIVRRAIILANAVIFMWISVKIYVPLLAALQKALGPTAFNIFGKFGNVVVALLTIVFFFAVSLTLGYGLRHLSRRVESFLLRQPEPSPIESGSR